LNDTILSACEDKIGTSLFINGKSGIGKTYTITAILDTIRSRAAYRRQLSKLIYMNAKTLETPKGFFDYLMREVFKNVNSMNQLKEKLCEKGKMILMVIDEVETFVLKTQLEMLFEIFALPYLKKSRVILITISNTVNLTYNYLPELKLRDINPIIFTFKPYTDNQLIEILGAAAKTPDKPK